MAKEPLTHPQLTETQYEIWISLPVTKAFLNCIEWKRLDVRDQAGTGALVDSSNADLTHALLHRAMGAQDLCAELANPATILDYYEMIDHPPPEEKEDE